MIDFIDEYELRTLDGWLKYQAIDKASLSPEELDMWLSLFAEANQRALATPKLDLIKLKPIEDEYRYAVAVREGSNLWLVLWVRRSAKGEIFVLLPRGDAKSDVHSSYHLDGTYHHKSYKRTFHRRKGQPLTQVFLGTFPLISYSGFGPKTVGAVCNNLDFNAVLEVPSGVLGPRNGSISVDLVEPDHNSVECLGSVSPFCQGVYKDSRPWITIRVFE
jgi:hypothetical protein